MTPQRMYERQVETNARALRIKKVAHGIKTGKLADKVAEAVAAEAVGDEKTVRIIATEQAEVVFGLKKQQQQHQQGKPKAAPKQQQQQKNSSKKQSGGAGNAASKNQQPSRRPPNPGRGRGQSRGRGGAAESARGGKRGRGGGRKPSNDKGGRSSGASRTNTSKSPKQRRS